MMFEKMLVLSDPERRHVRRRRRKGDAHPLQLLCLRWLRRDQQRTHQHESADSNNSFQHRTLLS